MKAPPQPDVQRVALYARVSTEDQAERGTIDAQRTFLAKFAGLYQLDVADEYVDDGYSGTLALDQRPAGRRLLEDAGRGDFSTVLVYRLDRLGRSLRALLDAHDALERAGVTVRSATEPFDTSTPIGKFLFQLLASLAELEKSTIIERTTMGRDRVARLGKWTNGPVPAGYDLDGEGRPVPSARTTATGAAEADVVRSIFERIAGGATLVSECRRLQALGIPAITRFAGRPDLVKTRWWNSTLHKIVKNPIYKGEYVLESRHGAVSVAVPALVETGLWERAQAAMTRNRSLSKRPTARDYLLRGIARCGGCGRTYVGGPGSSPDRDGNRKAYYRCSGALSHHLAPDRPRCNGRAVQAEELERLVWEDIRTFLENPGQALSDAQDELRHRVRDDAGFDRERRELQDALAIKADERERALTLYRKRLTTLAETERTVRQVDAEIQQLQGLLDALGAQTVALQATEAHFGETVLLLESLRERVAEIEQGDRSARRALIELLVRDVTIVTEGEGLKKRATALVNYAFAPPRVVDSTVPAR